MNFSNNHGPFEAVKHLAPTPLPRPYNESEYIGHAMTNKQRFEATGGRISQAVEIAPLLQWELPVSFDALNLPKIDVAFLPPEFREYCEGICHELQVPVELVMGCFLATVSTCI